MYAVIGSTVYLPCNLTPPSPDDSFSLVLWYRLDLPNPIYTLDARSASSGDAATHFASKVFFYSCYLNCILKIINVYSNAYIASICSVIF